MIGYYSVSLQGSNHQENGIPNQDCKAVRLINDGWVVAVVADGLSSATYSELGSKTAVDSVICFFEKNCPKFWHVDSIIATIRLAFVQAIQNIKYLAKSEGVDYHELETTLTCAVYNNDRLVYGHIGDGGIITLDPFGCYHQLTTPQKGEHFNETAVLVENPKDWVFGISNEPVAALLLATDGIYDILCPSLLAATDNPLWINQIKWFIDCSLVELQSVKDFSDYERKLLRILSEKNFATVSDDKTIIGIVNTSIVPERMPSEYYEEPDWKSLKATRQEGLYEDEISNVLALTNEQPCDFDKFYDAAEGQHKTRFFE
ncbi:hypothetical protein FACS1894219_04490 [Clostridia bacterium]|nr:hypothetical protein FACS1894219_04490 [Clostridia bacterium]